MHPERALIKIRAAIIFIKIIHYRRAWGAVDRRFTRRDIRETQPIHFIKRRSFPNIKNITPHARRCLAD